VSPAASLIGVSLKSRLALRDRGATDFTQIQLVAVPRWTTQRLYFVRLVATQ
jgi:hypothetical protein